MNKKIIIFLSCLLVLTMLFTGCNAKSGDVDSPVPGGDAGTAKDTLVYVLDGEPKTLDCSKTADQLAYTVVYQIHDYLIDRLPDGTLAPGLALNWEYSEDGKEITFHLRENVRFHNGEIMTAEDVAFSLNNAIKSPQTSRITSAMDSAKAIDENTVILTLKHSFGAIEYCIANAQMGIVNKKAYLEDSEGFERHPIGTGAYEFVEWKSGDEIRVKAYQDYYKDTAPIENIVFKIMLDKDTALMALEKGEVDFMFDIPKTGIKKVNDNSNLEYYVTNAASTCFVVLNNENEILSNKKVRQALAHAVDKESLILGAVEGYGTPAETPISTSAFGWPEDFQNREYDIEKAKKLLSEAGYPDGFKIEFTATETLNFKKPGEILQDQFKKIGVELEIKEVEFGIYLDDVISGNNYQMAVTEQSTAYPDADHIYSLYHSTMRNVGRNFVNVNLPELDKLLDKGRVSNDPVERKAIYKEVCELWKEECITIPTYSLQTDVAANKDLKGILAHSPSVYKIYYYSWDN